MCLQAISSRMYCDCTSEDLSSDTVTQKVVFNEIKVNLILDISSRRLTKILIGGMDSIAKIRWPKVTLISSKKY